MCWREPRIRRGKPDGQTITIKPDGTISVSVGHVYELGEIYYFRNPTLKPGFQPCQGGLLQQAGTLYPQIWAYLQTTEGQKLCTTENEWQAMTQATWGDGSFKASWNGIGGAPYFVQDLAAGTLRMPDIRGMFAVAAGDGVVAPSIGMVKGDAVRNTKQQDNGGSAYAGMSIPIYGYPLTSGPLYNAGYWRRGSMGDSSSDKDLIYFLGFDPSRIVPTGPTNIPRSWAALACVYLGHPATA